MAVKQGPARFRGPAGGSLAVQRGIDTVSEYRGGGQKLAAPPIRARLLRKRRWALRPGCSSPSHRCSGSIVTAVLASWSTPAWALLITGIIAAGAAVPATLLLLRYRWLRSRTAATAPSGQRPRLPPHGSAARPPMAALAASERGMHSLLGVLERGRMLPPEEIRELRAAASRTAATMAATAGEVVSMGVPRPRRPARIPTWRPPSTRSPPSSTPVCGSTTKWPPPQRNSSRQPTPVRCRVRRCRSSATATNCPAPPTGCSAGRRPSRNSASCAGPEGSRAWAEGPAPPRR